MSSLLPKNGMLARFTHTVIVRSVVQAGIGTTGTPDGDRLAGCCIGSTSRDAMRPVAMAVCQRETRSQLGPVHVATRPPRFILSSPLLLRNLSAHHHDRRLSGFLHVRGGPTDDLRLEPPTCSIPVTRQTVRSLEALGDVPGQRTNRREFIRWSYVDRTNAHPKHDGLRCSRRTRAVHECGVGCPGLRRLRRTGTEFGRVVSGGVRSSAHSFQRRSRSRATTSR